jgi:hypothetical protein
MGVHETEYHRGRLLVIAGVTGSRTKEYAVEVAYSVLLEDFKASRLKLNLPPTLFLGTAEIMPNTGAVISFT